MRRENKKNVFFDLDHTLWDFEKNSALAFGAVFEKHKLDVNHAEFLSHYVPINMRYWKLYRDEQITQQELRYGRFKETFSLLGKSIDDSVIDTLSADYIMLLPTYNHLFAGAIEILDYLRAKYSLHIITNGFHEVQAGKIKNAGIAHYFTTVTNSELAGCKKPNPLIFEYALKTAGADKETSIMIGDCIEADVQGALNCGLDAIYFNENRLEAPAPITQVHNLIDLKNFL